MCTHCNQRFGLSLDRPLSGRTKVAKHKFKYMNKTTKKLSLTSAKKPKKELMLGNHNSIHLLVELFVSGTKRNKAIWLNTS